MKILKHLSNTLFILGAIYGIVLLLYNPPYLPRIYSLLGLMCFFLAFLLGAAHGLVVFFKGKTS